MKKLLAVVMLASVGLLALTVFAPAASATAEAHKWYVCKYVGPPGSGEVLQTGNNPIFVDENSIEADPVFIGATFSDAHSHSLVIAGPFIEPLEVEPTCPGQTPPQGEASAVISTPTCVDPKIRVTGSNLTDQDEITFDVFINGVLVDSFIELVGQQGTGPALSVVNGDVVTVKVGEKVLATLTVSLLNCQPGGGGGGGGGGGTSCPGKIVVGKWYGDPRVNIDLTGAATFVVSGGVQRFTGLHRITKTLACNETFRIGRYKVKAGHYLNISMNGVQIVHVQPPVRN
jgi:hypothetical protein